MQVTQRKLKDWLLHRIQVCFNLRFHLCHNCSKRKSVNSNYKENNFKPCLTIQLLNTFKLWCEWSIRHQRVEYNDSVEVI